MVGGDEQSTLADFVGGAAIDLEFVIGEVGNAAIVLLVLGISEKNDALDLILNGAAESRNGS